ncbi:MAG: ATP-binding response regulator, partial [Candidatus Methylomirabilis sp.]
MNTVEQELSRSLGPGGGGHTSPETSGSESYNDWRRRFASERLRVLYYLGLVANPVFIAADLLLYREHLRSLLAIRSVLELGLLICFLGLIRRIPVLRPQVLLVLWVLIGNLCIVAMTVVLGGFTSQYYNGLNLVFLAASVIVPISWQSHLVAQVGTLLAYYGANALLPIAPADLNAAIQNSFFLVWTCIALLFSVTLYERLQRAEFQARLSERHARQELETSHKKLLELDRLKSEFFANISHEIRTPLTLSLGAYRTLLKLSPSSECQELIQSGLRNTARLLFLINELLDLAKFESGRAELKKRCIDLASLVRGVAANFDSGARRRIHFRGMEQPVAIEADPLQIKKVLYNLLSNAFKFSDPEEGQVWMRLRAPEAAIELEIEDNGIGIPHDQLERIFDRFTQVEGSATRRYEGTGIGLALVKEIVGLHKGKIAVESKLGQGSTFTITLPRGGASLADIVTVEDEEMPTFPLVHESRERRDRAVVPSSASTGRLPLVLVTEDNADMRAYVEAVLNGRYRIALAKDGVEGLEQA